MELQAYLRALRKSWWVIVACAVLLGAAGGAFAVRQTAQYASTVTFFATTPATGPATGSAYAGDQFAQQRVNTYVNLLSSDRLAQMVVANSNVDQNVHDVQASIKGESENNTVLLTATVTAPDPQLSLAIASGVAVQFPRLVETIEGAGGTKKPLVHLDVVNGPALDIAPVSPGLKLYVALGMVVGLALGVALALAKELLDNTVRSSDALRALTALPVLGVIGRDSTSRKAPLIIDSASHSIRAESFRQLRTNLQFVDVDEPASVFVITSSLSAEGKSTTAANLAITFAEAGRSVLLIDADLRRPKLASYLGLEGSIGLTNVLANQVDAAAVLQQWGTSGMTVLVSGSVPPNPSELLGSRHMVELIKAFRSKFEIVIIDTPPLLPVTDAAVVAAHADGAVVVVRYGSTKRTSVVAAVGALRAVDARVLGTVLTFSPPKGADAQGAYRGYKPYVSPERSVFEG